MIDPEYRPQVWPDFMDKVRESVHGIHARQLKAKKDETKKIYPSEKILGELFRIVNDLISSQKVS